MIGVASKADGDIVRKTEVLRASADELALKTEDQGKDLATLRNAIEQLKSDQSTHITRAIARMGEIDAELKSISDEKIQYDRRTAEALKDIESIRRELVQLGAKLAKEFITLPLPVARYPRLDQSSQKDEFVLLSQNKEKERNQNSPSSPRNTTKSNTASKNNNNNNIDKNSATNVNSIWYTDDQPAANLQCIDLVISSAVAALDGRLTDQEFRDEIEASRNDPESVFSKESLIRSVAAASPMKRRRASLLMLAQASRELQKQSATIDDLTRGPMRWSEVERIQAEKNVQMHDGMIRDAVRELCKVAPVPRQAERQLLTALDLHAMPTYRNLDGSPARSSSPTSHDESKNSGSGFDLNSRNDSPSDAMMTMMMNGNNNNMNSKTVKISQPPSLQLKRKKLTNTFSTSNYLRTNVSMEELGEAVERYADLGNRDENARYSPRDAKIREEEMARQNLQMYGESVVSKPRHVSSPIASSRTKDPMLRQLQAELQEEQSAMGLRSHAARVKAWQELDLKRAAKNRFNINDVSNANNLATIIEKRQVNIITNSKIDNSMVFGGSPCASTTTGTLLLQNDLLIPSSLAGVYSSVMMQSAAVYNPSSSPSASSPMLKHILSSPGRKSTPTIIPARIISPARSNNASPPNTATPNTPGAGAQLRSASQRTPTSITLVSDKIRRSTTATPPPPPQQQQQQQKTSNFGGISSEAINPTASPLIVHRSTGLIVRPQHQQHHVPQVGEVIRKNKSNSASFIMTSNNNNNNNNNNNSYNMGASSPGSFLFNNNHLQTNSASLVDSQLLPTTTSTMTNASPTITLITAKAGIPDPTNATQAVSMRRTGALEAAGLSFHSSRLDEAAKRLGVVRPPSAGAGYCARNGIGSRMHWKLKNRPHELEEDARLISEEATKRNDPKSLD